MVASLAASRKVVFLVCTVLACALAATPLPSLYGLIGNDQGTVTTLVTLTSNGQWKMINNLDWTGGSVGEFKVDFKNQLMYMGTLSMTNLTNYLFQMDLKGNPKTVIQTPKPILFLEWDQGLNTFAGGSVDLVEKVPDLVSINFATKTVTDTLRLGDNTQFMGVGISSYIQANHSIIIITAGNDGTGAELTLVNTQNWTITAKYPWKYLTFAMTFDDASSTLYQTAFNPKTDGIDVVAVEIPSLKAQVIYSTNNYCCGAGANAYDPSTGTYFVALQDSAGNNYLSTIDAKKRKGQVAPIDFLPYAFVVQQSSDFLDAEALVQ